MTEYNSSGTEIIILRIRRKIKNLINNLLIFLKNPQDICQIEIKMIVSMLHAFIPHLYMTIAASCELYYVVLKGPKNYLVIYL